MKLLTQFSIPKPIMADLARVSKNSKKVKKIPMKKSLKNSS
tara:strand:- start:695 stop:817 length:123 start_codon:yes stop_codon:yes gene_type:complete